MPRSDVAGRVGGPGAGTGSGSRAAGIALLVLGAVLMGVVAVTTPWNVLGPGAPEVRPDPARDFTPAQLARADAFDAATSLPGYLSLALTLVIAGVLVLTPVGARLIGRIRGPWWVRAILGVLGVYVVSLLLRWPLGMWMETVLREYGLSTQTWGTWTADRLKNFGLQVVLSGVAVLVIVALARKWPRTWWIPASLGAFTLTVVLSFAYPVVVEPMFNTFTPLPAGQLRADLLAMAAKDGVPVKDVLVADASRRTTALNAYVSGFGATRRIVVYDTLVSQPADEVKLIVAHELGHAKRDDVLYGTLVGALGAAAGTCLLFIAVQALRRRAGVSSAGDPRAVGLLVGLISLGTVLSGPAQNVVSRQIEARADAHALDLTRDPATFVAMQKSLAVRNISDLSPNAVEYLLYASHPSTAERIAMARSWAGLNGLPRP
ncbi:M48 family metallopeptidase [Microtetraspora sp. AC03309]|uniref:M48 family metallopeptidase n=1 Tax=Microtetraspora sp. AC03309 TaxID=2779376 RepID=UPI001E2FE23D|nr:M48 family metallopeptidase [Microtetraspora sp. AC03309]MCC5578221.1 M48 family metallopeptidase [Microtetraspora sp. AC03309]